MFLHILLGAILLSIMAMSTLSGVAFVWSEIMKSEDAPVAQNISKWAKVASYVGLGVSFTLSILVVFLFVYFGH